MTATETRVESGYRTCAVCGHEWVRREEDPIRCPKTTCRSKRWRDGYDGRAGNGRATESGENLTRKNSKKSEPEKVAPLSNPVEDPRTAVVMVQSKHGMSNSAPRAMPEWKRDSPPKASAAEIAAQFGIKTGATIEEVEPRLLQSDPAFGVYSADVAPPRQPSRNWMKFYSEMEEMEPGEAMYEFGEATRGLRLPVGFLKMPKNRQVAWLMENA